MSDLKIGFIGAGDISLLHAEAVAEAKGAVLHGLWNRTETRGAERAAQFNCKQYPTVEALIGDDAIDAVYILTNMETHVEYGLAALAAGKHVLVEKPVGADVAEIRTLKEAADASGLQCMPVHNYIYEDSVMRTKSLLDSGKLGDLIGLYIMYNIRHPPEVAERYPGVIRQILTHHSYITLYLAGRPIRVSTMTGVINNGDVTKENVALANMQLPGGGLGHLQVSWAADDHAGDPWTFMIKVIGTKGATRYSYRDWVENTPAVVHSQTYSAYPGTIKNTGTFFIERCLAQGQKPLSSLQDAIDCQFMIDALEASAGEGRHVDVVYE